ncbi:MAG: molybdopterin molybdenumtransferase MoeA [Actinobacteria bacterium HGW-Actinobacteria-4]|nr:MAG: molybdopterin molybdenumtransferase MoeA [Actinobacteria bacterium HGW-Actinobacteria-4]
MTARSLADHAALVLDGLPHMPVLDVMLSDAAGAMLADDLIADSALPPFDVASTDGYAVRSSDVADATATAPVVLAVTHDVSFDTRGPRRMVPGTAARISSGAPLPTGADAVVPVADTDRGLAKVSLAAAVDAGQWVTPAGFDAALGTVAVAQGTRLGSRQLAVAAALGRSRLTVRPVPRVVIMAVGSELMEPGTSRPGGGVHESTSHLLAAAVREAGSHAYRAGVVRDDRYELRAAIEDQLVRADVIITTGGLSEAQGDTLPHVLGEFGEVDVVELALEPGRRHGFGFLRASGDDREIAVFALPGSPVAAAVAFEAYVRSALRAMSGRAQHDRRQVIAKVKGGWTATKGVSQLVPVTIAGTEASGFHVTPTGEPPALSLTALAKADGFVVSTPSSTAVRDGDTVTVALWEG